MSYAFSTDDTDVPVCPHCGRHDDEWWDTSTTQYDQTTWAMNCESCGEKYDRTVHVITTFTMKATEQ